MGKRHFIWSKLSIRQILLIGLVLRLSLMFWVWHPDLRNHMDWGERFFEYGAKGFFAPEANVWNYTWPNQPPGTIYMYALVYKLFRLVFQGLWWVNVKVPLFPSMLMLFFDDNLYPAMLKLPAILSELGIGYLIYKIFNDWKQKKLGKIGALVWLLNPAIWYNSTIWGQTDAVINFFALLSFYLLLNKKWLTPALLTLALSLYIKISLVIFSPLLITVALKMKLEGKYWLKAMGFALLIIGLLTWPFSQGEPFSWLYWLYTKKILGQQLQVITANAFNIWATLTGIHEQPHTLLLGPLSYQYWGYLIFGGFYIWVLGKMMRSTEKESVWWGLALISFGGFMLLTNMHERYLYPLFPYLTILAVKYKRLVWLLGVISLISLLNLYNFWWVPRIEPVVWFMSFGNRLTPRVLGLVSFGVFMKFVSLFIKVDTAKR